MSATYQVADPFSSDAFKSLEAFVGKTLESPVGGAGSEEFQKFEGELHEVMASFEAEIVGRRLQQYDVDADEIEVHGDLFRRKDQYEKEYHGLTGTFTVNRTLYVPRSGGGKAIVPLEYRAGIVEGSWTPRPRAALPRTSGTPRHRQRTRLLTQPSPSKTIKAC